jgi:hypothetical protein
MSNGHTHLAMNSMKAYLLGRLDSSEADAFEDMYFADRKVLLQLKACEDDLIAEYLDNRLMPGDRDLFERRYLSVPELRRRLAKARRQRTETAPVWGPRGTAWRMALATLLVLAVVGVWMHRRLPSKVDGPHKPVVAPAMPALIVTLTAGVAKGSADGAEVRLPGGGKRIRFLLEAEDATGPTNCLAEISIIGAKPERVRIWRSTGPLPSEKSFGRTYFVLDVDSVILHRADYVVTLSRGDGEIIDNYLFRALD